VRNTSYALGGIGDFSDTVGKVMVGRLDNADQQPSGFWTFPLVNTRLDPDAVRPIIRGVSSLRVLNGSQQSALLQGDIELAAGSNVQLVTSLVEGQDPVIRINVIQGEGTADPCVCEGENSTATPIESINGVRPAANGTFTVLGSDCLHVETISNGIRLVDTCSAPCCGCAELERITQDLKLLENQAALVQTFVNTLQSNVETMSLTVLGSRLNDRGCITCN
jgi:hypothetical protein